MAKHNWTGERLETGVFSETTIEHLHRYAIAMDLVNNKKVLDIACGEGYGSALLATRGSHVTGVDSDNDTIRKAKEKYKKENLIFLAGTVENIPVADHGFEVVVSFETLEHITEQEKMMGELKRVLQPEGLLIISTPDKKNYSDKTGYKNPFHKKELYPEEFRTLLEKHFKNVQLLHQQVSHASIITTGNATGVKSYDGNYQEIKTGNPANGLYCIALASDQPLPTIENSFFNGVSVFEQALAAKEKEVTGSLTYKLGNTILYPAKFLRKLFKK